MTDQQITVLRLLSLAPRVATQHTRGNGVAGRTVACLMRMGLATRNSDQLIQITDAGRAALEPFSVPGGAK